MNASASLDEVLSAVAKILLWCFVLGTLILFLLFGLFLVAGDIAYQVHSSMFDLSEHEFHMIWYCGMGLLKAWVFVLFLIPWIGVRLALRGMRRRSARTP
ncbi:MAG TPA: hypothetical protein VMY37_10790 [Thermoguttaceae bacterium]|nr:hypothetical protein [Thermoguttaceae bacterium]